MGSSTAGTLTESDVDYFVVTVNQAGTLTASIGGETLADVDLEDVSGNSVSSAGSRSGNLKNWRDWGVVSAGTYYIRVGGFFSYEGGDGYRDLEVFQIRFERLVMRMANEGAASPWAKRGRR